MTSRKQIWWWLGGLVFVGGLVWILIATSSKPPYNGGQETTRPTKGPADVTIVLEEFSDFQCPACKSAKPVVDDIIATFGDRIIFKYLHFPLVSIHTQAFRAALAAECANDQGKFWEYHDILFDNQPNFSRDDLVTYARQLNLNIDGEAGFSACLDSRAKTDVVRTDMREGENRNVNGTPSFFLNGEAVADWSELKNLIQAKLIGG